ncbi:MAG: YihY/virulence factor BrkB family protein [Tissierellia bacterium]|nr:YihY/virulence factor BrkB family protein [Tissierellia bacterium]
MKKAISNFINKNSNKKWFHFIDELLYRIIKVDVISAGAQLAYFLMLSLFPLLIFILGMVNSSSILQSDYLIEAIEHLPDMTKGILENFINAISNNTTHGVISIAAIGSIWSSSTGVFKLMKVVESTYDEENNRSFFLQRFMSIVFTFALLFLMTLLTVLNVLGSKIGKTIFEFLGAYAPNFDLWNSIEPFFLLAYMVLVMVAFYRYSLSYRLRKDIKFKHLIFGAAFTSVMVLIFTRVFSLYVDNFSNYSVVYGSLAGIIILLVWLFAMGIIFILGGIINAAYYYSSQTDYDWPKEYSFFKKLID